MGCAPCRTEHTTDAWAPVELTWSVIRAGDIILATRTRLPWIVTTVTGTEVTAVRGAATHRATPDPDAAVDVLCPLVERDALVAARDGLDAQIVDRSGPR